MSKRIFVLLIILMSIALIGIISVQIYWINSSIDIRDKQFTNDVKFALANVSENIQEREINEYYKKYKPIIDSVSQLNGLRKKDFYFQQIDTINNEIFSFRQSILERNYKSSIPLFENDSLTFKTFFGEKEKEIKKIDISQNDFKNSTPEERIYEVGRLSRLEAIQYENIFKDIAPRQPIYNRISTTEISLNLDNELRERGIDIRFEFGVFGDGLATKVKSLKFNNKNKNSYSVPLFIDNEGGSDYELYVNFPKKNEYILASISNILILGTVFIFIIILAFASAIYQLIKQKQISEIKTDFISNMTHEFKTPIATINLALDAIKNPKIINDKEKVLRYVEMIREENKRMHGQVENVLQISRLEKNQLDLKKGVADLHDIIKEAINHIDLIVKDNEGYINLHLEAIQSEVMINEFHFTNVIVNILDNAVKYTNEPPKINIYTENAGNYIILSIKDQGIGMNKNVQKQVFDKFYREQKINIHDVKGHGLGLSYVKKIVEYHHGNVYVESEKGKGSTFTIKLPLI
ncbi:MAG TPA: two-component sensor histidine kinase [Flavobacteriaceae bacterium]|nr:two-component sensor histidine kinase [Flavobacteriaceae bacterium]HBS11159.1 two-component sensor histidine kinase [Flavobacteriaceae bacterium]